MKLDLVWHRDSPCSFCKFASLKGGNSETSNCSSSRSVGLKLCGVSLFHWPTRLDWVVEFSCKSGGHNHKPTETKEVQFRQKCSACREIVISHPWARRVECRYGPAAPPAWDMSTPLDILYAFEQHLLSRRKAIILLNAPALHIDSKN